MFPDPSTSSAYYTKYLFIECPQEVVAADAEEGGWIRGFSRVVELEMDDKFVKPTFSLIPFYALSPAITSLDIKFSTASSSQVSDLIYSFPLLENLP